MTSPGPDKGPGDPPGSETQEDVTFEHSAVFVMTVVDGKVTVHRDFVDYSTFREQLRQAGG